MATKLNFKCEICKKVKIQLIKINNKFVCCECKQGKKMEQKKYNKSRNIKTNDKIEYKAKRLREERQEKYANISHVYRKGIIELYKKEFGED